MKLTRKIAIALFISWAAQQVVQAQSADEIIQKYFETTGGMEQWKKVKSLKSTGTVKQGGMDFPFVFLQGENGMTKNSFTFQGKEMVSPAFDGKEGWSINFMTMKAEKMESEDAENMKRAAGEFPDPFLDYKTKGYVASYEGKEKFDGTECHKIKLVKTPQLVDGKEEENVTTYFFDLENNVPIASKSIVMKGEAKGSTSEMVMSDYQEVNGLFMPFSISQRFNGQEVVSIKINSYQVNVPVDKKEFAFPASE